MTRMMMRRKISDFGAHVVCLMCCLYAFVHACMCAHVGGCMHPAKAVN